MQAFCNMYILNCTTGLGINRVARALAIQIIERGFLLKLYTQDTIAKHPVSGQIVDEMCRTLSRSRLSGKLLFSTFNENFDDIVGCESHHVSQIVMHGFP